MGCGGGTTKGRRGAKDTKFGSEDVRWQTDAIGPNYTYSVRTHRLTAVIEREGGLYVSLCPELDVASQGKTVEEARRNLVEALELFFEVASATEIEHRFAASEVYVTSVDVPVA